MGSNITCSSAVLMFGEGAFKVDAPELDSLVAAALSAALKLFRAASHLS